MSRLDDRAILPGTSSADNRPARHWRQTDLTHADGSPAPDDWCLVDSRRGAIAHIYMLTSSPRRGQ
jgi:hypothetical protein